MDERLARCRAKRLAMIGSVALALVAVLGATPSTAITPTGCRVRNADSAKTYARFRAAIHDASDGDRLTVRGTCLVGSANIDKDLTIDGVRRASSGQPILIGEGKTSSLVVTAGSEVVIRRLEIRGLRSRRGGIINKGSLELTDTVVRGMRAGMNGGGICNMGILALHGTSTITRTKAGEGGVYNDRGAFLTLNDTSSISRNGSFGVSYNNGTVTLNDTSSISRNNGEGVFNNGGTLTLNDDSAIFGNRDGGVSNWALSGTVTLNDASAIRDNDGRGVFNEGTLVLNGSSSISGHWAENGGGVWNVGSLTLNGSSSVSGNVAHPGRGGGVYNGDVPDAMNPRAGTLTMNDAGSISGNTAWEAGGGVFHRLGDLVGVVCGPGGNVYGNSPDDCVWE